MVEFTDKDLSGSNFRNVDLSDSRLHCVAMERVKITDAWLRDVDVSGDIESLTVNGVEVSDFVRSQLDERHPERRMLSAADGDGLRAAWAMLQQQAQATVERARALPAPALDESVDGEWSYLQTLRHLVFATDRWITAPVLAEPEPFHRLGYAHDSADEGPELGLDPDARPSLDEVLAARHDRMARVSELLRTATDDDLLRTVDSPNGGTTSVVSCVHVVFREEWWHNQYATRDLDVLAKGAPSEP